MKKRMEIQRKEFSGKIVIRADELNRPEKELKEEFQNHLLKRYEEHLLEATKLAAELNAFREIYEKKTE